MLTMESYKRGDSSAECFLLCNIPWYYHSHDNNDDNDNVDDDDNDDEDIRKQSYVSG